MVFCFEQRERKAQGESNSLGMAAPGNELFLFVREADRSVREGFADCKFEKKREQVLVKFGFLPKVGGGVLGIELIDDDVRHKPFFPVFYTYICRTSLRRG